MDIRDLIKLAGIINPEVLNRIQPTAPDADCGCSMEEADSAGFDAATTKPEPEVLEDPMASMGSDADLSLRRYLKAKGDHVTVDEHVYPDYTVEDVNAAYSAFKEAKDYGPGKIGAVQKMLDKERDAKKAKDDVKESDDDDGDEGVFTSNGLKWNSNEANKSLNDLKKLAGIAEADLDENAFNQAAAAAARAGKDSFEFNGKTYKTKMDKDTAHKLSERSSFKDYRNSIVIYDPTTMEVKRTYPITHGKRASDDAKRMNSIATTGDDYMDLVKNKNRMSKDPRIDEADIDENAFNQAVAAAARAGKDSFEFNGKTYKTKMDKSTAHKLDDDVDILRKLAGLT